jgi:hypothetical protein
MDGIENLTVSDTVVHSARGFSGLELGGFILNVFFYSRLLGGVVIYGAVENGGISLMRYHVHHELIQTSAVVAYNICMILSMPILLGIGLTISRLWLKIACEQRAHCSTLIFRIIGEIGTTQVISCLLRNTSISQIKAAVGT